MRQGMEPLKHQRNPNKQSKGNQHRQKQRDLWKQRCREQKRQQREW